MSFKPIDPKRDEIRRYLERGSVLDSLTKIFIRLIKERPENPMEYIRNNIGVVRYQHDKYERLTQELQEANTEIQRLRTIINAINPEVLRGQTGPQAVTESNDSEVVTVVEQVEAMAVTDTTLDTSQTTIAASSLESTTLGNPDLELAEAVDNCHIEEKVNVVADTKIDSANQISSVQAESNSTNNTE